MTCLSWICRVFKTLGAASLLAVLLAACGGGGGGEARCIPGVSTMAFPEGCPGDNLAGGVSASISLALVDPDSKVAITTVTPSQPGELRAVVKNAIGAVLPNVAVSFITTDSTGGFVPSSGTALTDANGVATVRLPAGSRAGAFTVSSSATAAGSALKTSLDYGVGFPTLSLGALAINPATLSAGGNAAVSVAVLSGGAPYTAPLAVSFSSPCIMAGKATMGASVLTQSGVANTSYTDKGCGVPDLITASVTLADATVTRSGSINVLPASVGAIRFVSADTTNIALKGTGGFGRQEFSTLRFEVFDQTGARLPGARVDFRFADSGTDTTVGGIKLNPAFATAAADGSVTTLVTAGLVPTSVRVVASVGAGAQAITTASNTLVASTSVPVQKHFSLSTETGNCEGWDIDQKCSTVTASVGDQFGNPVPDGTAVNFIAEGGLIGASCVTGSLPDPGATPGDQTTNSAIGPGSGTCSVLLRSSQPRPADGRITVLAYLLGDEDFFDANGNNRYDAGESFSDRRRTVFRNDDESGVPVDNLTGSPLNSPDDGNWNAGEPCIGLPTTGTPDCTAAGDGIYNGVLGQAFSPTSPSNVYVSAQLVQIFSGSHAWITYDPGSGICPASGMRDGQLHVTDKNDNPMPAGSEIYISRSPVFLDPPIAKIPNIALLVNEQNPIRPLVPPARNPYIKSFIVPASCTSSSVLFVKVVTPSLRETIQSFQINP